MVSGGLIREYEESRRVLLEQQAVIDSMPVKEGFGYENPVIPLPKPVASSSKKAPATAATSSVDRSKAVKEKEKVKAGSKAKRRKTPEYTSSEAESD